jgi:hypothetical protein
MANQRLEQLGRFNLGFQFVGVVLIDANDTGDADNNARDYDVAVFRPPRAHFLNLFFL